MLELTIAFTGIALSCPIWVIAFHLKRMLVAQNDLQLTAERIANQGEPVNVEAPESIARRMAEEGQRMATLQGEELEQVRADRAARREARRRGDLPDA